MLTCTDRGSKTPEKQVEYFAMKGQIHSPTLSWLAQNTLSCTSDVIKGANEGTFSPFPNRNVVEEGESTLGTRSLIRQSE